MTENNNAHDLLARQYEYFQYLFEQEQKRATSIVGGAKVYIAFLVFIMGSIFLKVITLDKIVILFNYTTITPLEKLIGLSMVGVASVALIFALLFTILVLKVWSYDRLCDPLERFEDMILIQDECEIYSKAICDFAIATSRNNLINNKRAEYLARGLACLLVGTLLSIIAAFTLNFIV